jgi:hypothetical protein
MVATLVKKSKCSNVPLFYPPGGPKANPIVPGQSRKIVVWFSCDTDIFPINYYQ